MGVLQQFRLLLGKNLLLRWRHPGILLLEVIWPILIVAVVALIRVGVPPEEKSTCHYQDRALPSAGLVPFLQTFVCNLDNKCHSNDSKYTTEAQAGSVSALVQQITPYLSDEDTLDMLDDLDKGVTLITTFSSLAQDETLMKEMDNATRLSHYFRDPELLKRTLVQDYNFSQDAVDALMDSQANINAILELSGYPDLKGVACDPERLKQFLYFPEGSDVAEVSRSLCDINDSRIPDITDFLQKQLDVAKVIRLLGVFESLKARLSKDYTWANGLMDVADMIELLLSIDDLAGAFKEISTLHNLTDILRSIPKWVEELQASKPLVLTLDNIVEAMDPLMSELFVNNSLWTSMKDALAVGYYVTDMVSGAETTNISSVQLMQRIGTFMQEIEQVFSEMPADLRTSLDSLAHVNWVQVMDLLFSSGENNQTVIRLGLMELQQAIEPTALWTDIAGFLPPATDLLHSLNMILHETIAARETMLQLMSGGGPLRGTVEQLLGTGPTVTLAVLKAFTHPDTLAKLLADGSDFSAVCTDVIGAIRDDIGETTANQLSVTLCSGDVAETFGSLLGDFDMKNITMSVDQAITSLMTAVSGNVTDRPASIPALWQEIEMMMYNLEQIGNTTATSWAQLFSVPEVMTDMMGNHSREWEPVLDMLDENYMGSSVLSLFGAAVRLMNDSSSAQWMQENLGPFVHMAASMMKGMYDQMQAMHATFSPESPLGQLVYYGTNYAPQMVTAIMDMPSNGNADMMYKLASSSDPMLVLCGDHMMQHMGLPPDVAVSMENVVCLTNWTEVGENLLKTQTAYVSVITDMMVLMTNGTMAVSLEEDWQQLSYYTSLVMDLMSSNEVGSMNTEDPLQSVMETANALNLGPWSLAMYANYSQVGVAVGMMMSHLQNMTSEDLNFLVNIAGLVMENVDQTMSASVPTTPEETAEMMQWRQIKHYFRIVDDVSTLILQEQQRAMFPTSLSSMLDMLPEEVRHMVNLSADAYLEYIDAWKNIILKPEELIQKMVSGSLQIPDCGSVTVTGSWLMLAPDSHLARLEKEICTANWADIAMKMASASQSQASAEALQDLMVMVQDLDYLNLDPTVNWTQVINNTVQALQVIDSQLTTMQQMPSTFDLLPFNMTAINAKWEQFYADMDQLQNMDFNSLFLTLQGLPGLLSPSMGNQSADNQGMLHFLNANLFFSQQTVEFLNIQLRYMSSTPVVNVLDMLGSQELRKAAQVLLYSPEINEIGVNTLIRMFSDPTKMAFTVDLPSLCTNLTLFSQVVAVDDSVISTPLLQQTVCDLNINTTLLLQELRQNWNGFAELLDAFEMLMQPDATLKPNMTAMTVGQQELNELLTSVITNPPMIILLDNDRWMNATLYEGPWKKLGEEMEKLYQRYQDPAALMSSLQAIIYNFASTPDMQSSLLVLDAMLDIIHTSTSSLGGVPESFEGYPNMEKFYSLLDQLPELLEMVAYTLLQHPEQLNNWAAAMTSWDTFCNTDPMTLMTAPPEGGLDVRKVFDQLCSINITQLLSEFNTYQGFDRLSAIMEGGNLTGSVNVTALAQKLEQVLGDFEDLNTTLSSMDSDLRFLNSSVWAAVFARLGQDFNQTLDTFMSPELILQRLSNMSNVFAEFQGLQITLEQVAAVTDVILDQVLQSLQGGSLQEMFSKYPTLRSAVTLMDKLPEIYETLAYTGLYTPEKLTEHFSQMMSFDTFCGTDITLMLTAPPESDYNLTAWQHTLCSINVTVMLAELGAYQGTTAISDIFASNSSISVNLTSLSEKMEKVINEFSRAMSGNSTTGLDVNTFFNVTAWAGVMQHLQTWMQDASQLWGSPSFYKKLMSASLLSSLQDIPELNTALAYTSAILDVLQQTLERSTSSLSVSFAEYPNLSTLLSLLEDVPEIFEIFAFTTLHHPEQLARWTPAMASWETFCSYDPDSLLTAPPGSTVNVTSVLQRLCSLNVTELLIELNQYQGMDELQAVLSGSATETVNATEVAEQLSALIDSMVKLYSSPMDSGFNLRLFNQTVWEQTFQRLGQNLNNTQQQFMSPATLMDFYNKLFGGFSELNDTDQTLNKVWAMTDVILDQVLRSFQGGSLEDMFSQYPTIQSAVGLLDHLPEIYETVMYTALYAPDKVIARMEAFSSLETFCTTDMSTIFTVPDEVNFDLTAWQTQFCSLNLTVLMMELAQYQGTQDLNNIFSPDSTVTVNMTAVIQKLETVLGKLSVMNDSSSTWQTFNARFLNTTLWELAMSNLQKWASNTDTIFWMRPDRMILFYGDLLQNPNVTQDLAFMQPVFSVMALLMDKLFLYENKTTLTLEELFVEAPELQKVGRLLQEPGVIEVLLESANSEKFAPLLSTNNITTTFMMLCNPFTSLDEYLTVPDSVSIDLSSVKSQLCSIDLQQIPQELTEFFNIEHFAAALNGSLPVNYTALSQQAGRLPALINQWTQSPPVVTVPTSWQNESFWLGILERYATSRQNTSTIIEELERFTDSLGTLMTNDPMRQVGLVAQTMLRLLNENLPALRNQNLTLENLVQHVPILQDVFSALGVEGDILNAMLKAPVQSSQMLLEALLTDGKTAQDSVCNITRLQEMLQLPVSFNSTALYQAVCLKDDTEAVNNLVRNLNLQGLIDSLESPLSVANWTEIFQQSEELQEHFQNLITHPPTFNTSSLMAMLESSFNTSDLWQMSSMFNYYQLFGMLDAFPELKVLKDMVRVQAVMVEFLNDLVNRLVVDGVTLDLASLFSSSPSFVKLMDAAVSAKPDLVTALASVQLNLVKATELMTLSLDSLQSVMCSPSEFQKYFIVAENVNITEILDVLCSLNFTQFAAELTENFMVDAFTKKFAMAMNDSVPFDIQKQVTMTIGLVEHIMNLTNVKNVTFHGNSLGHAFDVNITQLLEAMESVSAKLQAEYAETSSASLHSALAGLANSTEGQSIIVALKIMELYLHSFNSMLEDISTGPISLAAIVNNTEMGNIVMPFLQNPQSLQELLDLQLLPQELNSLLMSDNAMEALCGPELFKAFAAPGNESAILQQLQTSVCSANATVMMWQAIMGQANGYQLFLQMEALLKEVAAGKTSVNISAIDSDVQHMIQLVMQIVMEYQSGTRSTDDLLDWQSFEAIFNRFSSSLGERLMNMSQEWSADLMSALLLSVPGDSMSVSARTINTINIFMDIINDRLEDMIKNGVSLYTLLNNSASLVNLMEAYLDITRLSTQGWLDNQFNLSRLLEVTMNSTLLVDLCASDALTAYLADGSPNTTLTSAMQTVMCSVMTELPAAFRQFIDYQALQTQITTLWNMSVPVEPQYQQDVDNIARFNALITQLATTPPSIDSQLPSQFDFTNMLEAIQNIATQPEIIFRLLKAMGIILDGPASTNDLQNTFYGINTYIAQPLLTLVENMDEAGVTLSQVIQDPFKLLEVLPVLMNFNMQFDVIASTYLQPTMNKFWNREDFRNNTLCNGQLPQDVFTSSGIDPSVVSTLCTVPSTEWIQTLKDHNYTEAQIISWVTKVEDAYMSAATCYTNKDVITGQDVLVCTSVNADLFDNKGLYWMRLMATLESVVTHIVPNDDKDGAAGVVDSFSRMVYVLKDAFLNKTLESAMNYLEAVDRMGQRSHDWLVFKQIMSFLQSAGSLLNTGLHGMTDSSGTVHLQDLLPDSQKLADLLSSILGPASASEMLTASVNPQLFYQLSSIGQLQSLACDPVQFSMMFTFPAGTNVTAVQVDLCDAATERSSSVQELIDLFQAGDVLVQLDRLLRGDYSSVEGDKGLWQALHTTVSDMLTYFEQIQNGQFNMSVTQTWLDPLLQQLMNLNPQTNYDMDTVCRSYIALIGGTDDFQASQGFLVVMSRTMSIVTKVMPIMTKMDELICSMTKEDGLDIVAGVNFLRQNGLDSILREVSRLMENGTQGEFQCSHLIESSMAVSMWITNITQSPVDMDEDRLGQCLQQGTRHFADVLQGLTQLYRVITDVSHLMEEDDINTLLHSSGELGQVVDFLWAVLSQEQSAVLQFTDLLTNSTDVETYLTGVMKLAPETVTTLLESTISLNASTFLNHSVSELVNILCDPALLAEVIQLPDFSPFSISDLSTMLCTPDVTVTAGVLKDASKSADFIAHLSGILQQSPTEVFASTLTKDLVTLVTQLQSVSTLVDLLDNGFDVNFLLENADRIDAILAGGGTLNKIADSLVSLVGTLKYIVPKEQHYIISDIQTFISGLLGLDLIQSYLAEAIHVSDLQLDAGAVRQYLIDDLNFSPEAASALLSSTYSIRVFLNASALVSTDEPCEERLPQFILMNTTQQLQDEVTSKFCDLNTTQLTEFMQVMVPQLDIGTLIQKYITFSEEALLDSLNMTKSEAQTLFQSLSDSGLALGEATDTVLQNSSFSSLLSNMDQTTQGDFDAMVALQPALCGFSDLEVSDQFQLNSKVQGVSSPQDLAEEAQLNGDFCKDLFRSMKSTTMGSVIWAYVKPVMLGKILFTPDTPLTRKIIANANWVFGTLAEVQRVSRLWSEKVPSLVALSDSASDMDDIQAALSNSFVQGLLKSTMNVDPASITSGLEALSNNSMNATNLNTLQRVSELIYNFTTCLDLDRFEAVATEQELEQRAYELFNNNTFLGGIVFMNVENGSNQRKKRQVDDSTNLPPHIMYKIRMDMDNVPTTNRIKDRLWMPDANDNFAEDLRYMRGFIQLQDMVEGAILKLQTDGNYQATGVSMQQMPFPCHTEDTYIHYLGSYLLPMLMTFAWLAAIGIATHNLVYDRQSGQEESLHIMGMMSGLNVLAWILVTVFIMAFVSAIVTVIFKYGGVFPNSDWFLLFLYFLDFCFSTTMMCYLISAFFSRVTLAILSVIIIYFLSYLPYVILVSAEVYMTHWQKTLASLSSTTAFSFGAVFITRFEEEMVGLQWSKMNDKMGDTVDFAWMCYMMLIDSAIYLVLGWYIRNVKPGKYGVSQPWYFPVLPSYWCACLSMASRVQPMPPNSDSGGLFEPDPQGLDVGISLRELRKTFKGKIDVVHGVSVNIYHDQITTLLGHNGAAKTTTLNMLVGVLEPSDGEVLVEGKKTRGRTGLLGICPQHNTLFEFMTVKEHMDFYGGMKGHLSASELKREIRKLLHDVDLWHVKDVPALHLSGGMQRRLCVALAFVGGSKTIVLDEPTSGVDPHARKNIWNLILKNRPSRTILMSTHHLDEADMLSDRILIMHTGRLMSVGSPSFLKNQLGGGYKLTINTNPTLDVQNEMEALPNKDAAGEMSRQHSKVMTFLQRALPSARFVESVGSDLVIKVPSHADNCAVLSQFFRQLDHQKAELGVLSYGISNTTLEEVFLKLTAEADGRQSNSGFDTSTTDTESTSTSSDNTMMPPSGGQPKRSVKGASLKFQQLGALLLKRIHHYRRNWRMLISTLLLPLLAFLCAMGFSTLRPTQDTMRDLIMSPALYAQNVPESYAFAQDNVRDPASDHFMETLMADLPGIGTTCMAGFDAGKDFKCVKTGRMEQSEKKEQVCRCNDYEYECSDGTQLEGVQQMMTRPDIILQDVAYKDLNMYLVNSYINYIDQRFGGWSLEPPRDNSSQAKVWFNNKGYHTIPSYFNALSNNLLRSAVSSSEAHKYGITLYNHPLMLNSEQLSKESIEASATDIGIAMVILLALSFIPSAFMVYLTNEKVSQEKHLQSISGVGTVLYWSASLLWDLIVYNCTLAIMVIIVVIFKSDGYYDRDNLGAFALLIFLYGWAVIPLMYCTLRFFSTGSGAYLTLFCTNMLLGLLPTLCIFVFTLLNGNDDIREAGEVLQYVFLIFPQFSLGMGLVDLISNQVQYKLLKRFGEDTYINPFEFEMLGWNFVALAAEGLLFLLLTFFIHSRKERAISMTGGMHYNASKDDEDVFAEQERVHAGENGDSLAVKALCKVYYRGRKRFCAVNNLSFGVNKGECFGLLGVNGAGKTTTFKMLTGASIPSEGDAIIQHRLLSTLRSRLGDELGYCPQEDALDMYMSARETLTFHAKLRGFGSDQIEGLVSKQLKRLHLESLADKPVRMYSGGNKRKLSLAVAMLGDPPLLLMDEPTTGMDAATRRLAWKSITTATQRGQAVLLTSHSMDECESLCSRLAIMVNGQLKCIGSPQHLKHKFGDGYTVILHLQGLSSSRYNVAEAFLAHFPGSVIKDHHHSVVEVSIPREAGSVADIFHAVQDAQAQHHIMYYSVSQTTLDSVFVNFAREQSDDCEHDLDMESSSGGSTSASGDTKDGNFQKSMIGNTYAYMNPEYSSNPADSENTSQPSAPPPTKVLAFDNQAYSDAFVTKL